MKITDLQLSQNNINDLPNLSKYRYENIFNLGTNNNYYFYNIIKTIKFPENLAINLYYKKTITGKTPYTKISYDAYGTQNLWWLIILVNNITNPVNVITPGTVLKIIKPEFLDNIIDNIKNLNNV